MGDSKPVFVKVTAADCGACKNLKGRWKPIRRSIEDLRAVRIIEIQVPNMSAKVSDQGYPNDLQRYILWYPTFFLFRGDNWDEVMRSRGGKLDGVIFNGIVGNAQPQQGYPMTAEGITNWIKKTLKEDPRFSSSSIEKSRSPRDPRSSLYAHIQKDNIYVPTSGSAAICRKMKLKPKNRF